MATAASSAAMSTAAAAAAATSASSSAAAAEIQHALSRLRESIAALTAQRAAAATGASSSSRPPLLVAVSKTKPVEAVQHAYAAGCRHFGENYVQELVDKASSPVLSSSSAPGIRWHFIGHLQTNKAKQVARVPNLAMVESVDSARLASELNKALKGLSPPRPAPLPVLIQVNTSGEASKFGCAPDAAVDLFGHVLSHCPLLEPRGLMTIGRLADEPQPDCFDLLVKLREQICAKFAAPTAADATAAAAAGAAVAAGASTAATAAPSVRTIDPATFELSMGMSGDYACALERGATELRIGSTIFGAREYPNKIAPPPPEEEGEKDKDGSAAGGSSTAVQ